MATCDDTRQLTQAEREAAFNQQRTGVVQAVRPFSGPPTLANLIDYVNRELGPAVRNARAKVNDCFQQVTDNSPSANPLGYYFSSNTANADPTAGRVRLDASPENTATTLRVSESNARLQDVSAWLDMMIGGSTIPLGVVTVMDAINPGRFLRGNLTNITPQIGYRDLAITVFEASHPDPFVDGESVLVSYIAGMADGGVTVPVGVLAPIANDTFIGNVSGGTATPSAVALSTLAGAGLAFGTHTLDVTGSTSITITSDQVQRAALTGAVTAALNSNTTAFGALAAKSVLANATNASAVPAALAGSAAFQHLRVNSANNALEWSVLTTGDFPGNSVPVTALATIADDTFIGNIAGGTATPVAVGLASVDSTSIVYDATSHTFQRAALTGFATASQNGNATSSAEPIVTYSSSANMSAERVTTSSTSVTVDIGTAGQVLFKRAALTGEVTASADSNATTVVRGTDFSSNPWSNDHRFQGQLAIGQRLIFSQSLTPATLSSDQNDYNPTGWSTATVVRLSSTTTVHITGALQGVEDGDFKWLINIGTNPIHLDHFSSSSTTANRFLCPEEVDCVLLTNVATGILYDGTSGRWRPLNGATVP